MSKNFVLELPGSVFYRNPQFLIEAESMASILRRLNEMKELGLGLLISIGFENFQSSIQHYELKINRYIYDHTSNLEAQINALILFDILEQHGANVKLLLQGANKTSEIAEPYSSSLASKYMAESFIVLCNAAIDQGGLFDEDLSAAVRSLEVSAGALCKAVQSTSLDHLRTTNIGKKLEIKYDDVILGSQRLPLRASTASFCKEKQLPIILFDLNSKVSIADFILKTLPPIDSVTVLF